VFKKGRLNYQKEAQIGRFTIQYYYKIAQNLRNERIFAKIITKCLVVKK
jgi:hypothetical protein